MPRGVAKSGKRKGSPRAIRLEFKCEHCASSFHLTPGALKSRKGRVRFCGRTCSGLSRRVPPNVRKEKEAREGTGRGSLVLECHVCAQKVRKVPGNVGKHVYCSRACMTAHRRSLPQFDMKAWRTANADYLAQRAREWAKNNPEKRSAIRRRSAAKQREKIAELGALRTRAKAASGRKQADSLYMAKILEKADGRCIYCGLPAAKLEFDHVTPLTRGGRHVRGNLVPACRSCNASKSNKDVVEWLERKHGLLGMARAVWFLERPRRLPDALLPERT